MHMNNNIQDYEKIFLSKSISLFLSLSWRLSRIILQDIKGTILLGMHIQSAQLVDAFTSFETNILVQHNPKNFGRNLWFVELDQCDSGNNRRVSIYQTWNISLYYLF